MKFRMKAFFRTCWKLITSHLFDFIIMLVIIFGGILGISFIKLTANIVVNFLLGSLLAVVLIAVLLSVFIIILNLFLGIIYGTDKLETFDSIYRAEFASQRSKKNNH